MQVGVAALESRSASSYKRYIEAARYDFFLNESPLNCAFGIILVACQECALRNSESQ